MTTINVEGVTYINPSMYKNDGIIYAVNGESGFILIKAKEKVRNSKYTNTRVRKILII